jgi:probable F420-dependent oxidoreductase
MHVDAKLAYTTLHDVPTIAIAAERLGFDGLWTSETNHDPFLAMTLAAANTAQMTLGTAVALAFTRSPTTLAHTAWDLAHLSGGRFRLGLGTQVKGHITRRFGLAWDPPAPKLREVIGAIREVWRAWDVGGMPAFRGRYFNISLMTPLFTPSGPTPTGLSIQIAGVGPRMCRLAGEIADGFHMHPLHTGRYLREVVLPEIDAGLGRSGRPRSACPIVASTFVAMGTASEVSAGLAEIRRRIAFYASTPTYRPMLTLHGWSEVGERLSRSAARGDWDAMPRLVTDDMLNACAIWGTPSDIATQARERYAGIADRFTVYEPYQPGSRDEVWRDLIDRIRAG